MKHLIHGYILFFFPFSKDALFYQISNFTYFTYFYYFLLIFKITNFTYFKVFCLLY